jgi:hypothetical protein
VGGNKDRGFVLGKMRLALRSFPRTHTEFSGMEESCDWQDMVDPI